MTGKIKFFNISRGFGFIIDDETGGDVFVHITKTKEIPVEGDKVIFDIKQDKKGLHAFNVVKA